MVAVVGDGSGPCVARLGDAVNVVAASDPASGAERQGVEDVLDGAVTAWSEATRVHTPYFVHDADPLALVGDAWVRRADEQGPVGELEVAVEATLARWRVESIELPDYYLVLDAESMPPTRRHWYFGVLHRAAPARVVPVANTGEATRALPRLGAGRWWPDLDALLTGIDRIAPDQL